MLNVLVRSAEKPGDQSVLGLVHNYLAATALHRGRWQEAVEHIDVALDARKAVGDLLGWAVSLSNRTKILIGWGRCAEAAESAERAVKACRDAGAPTFKVTGCLLDAGYAK